jgi:hypothetical protein
MAARAPDEMMFSDAGYQVVRYPADGRKRVL